MRELRFGYLWLGLGVALLAVILFAAVSPPTDLKETLFEMLTDKGLHFAAFAVLMIWFTGILEFRYSPFVAAGLLGYGLLIEYIQSRLPYGVPDVADAYADIAGIVLGWILARLGLNRWCEWLETTLRRRN